MRKFIFGLILLIGASVIAQDSVRVLSLEECLDMALSRNLAIKRSQNNLIAAQSNRKQAYFNYLPSIGASVDYNLIDGTFFDNNSGQIISQARTSSPSISSNVLLFNAFSNHHLLNQRKRESDAALYALDDTKLSIRATVIRNYLTVLLDQENLKISNQRLSLLEQQLNREKKRVSVGVGSPETVYNFQSQASTERLNNVNLTNAYRRDMLVLLQSVQFSDPIASQVQIQDLDMVELEDLLEVDEFSVVVDEILAFSYGLKSADASKNATNSSLKGAKSARYPSITAGAGIGSQFSSVNEGDYVSQIEDRKRSFIGATLSIPIFNRYRTQNQIDQAKVSLLNAEIDYSQALLNVTNSAQSDYLDLVAAQTQYVSALENYEAQNSTFEFIKKRFETGNTDFYTYQESLNNKNAAEAQLANAKYTIVFRKRILDMYRGK